LRGIITGEAGRQKFGADILNVLLLHPGTHALVGQQLGQQFLEIGAPAQEFQVRV
jgi:hypothetical protein